MTLLLEIEYLSGVSFAALGPDTDAPEWPPQPDRVYSALVAAWAARGEHPDEAEALEWLEGQEPPRIDASGFDSRGAPDVFVPPNDARSSRNAEQLMPTLRRRQPRRFPAARPHDSIVLLRWDAVDVPPEILPALDRVARDVAYVGHSSALTRCRFVLSPDPRVRNSEEPPRRRVYRGRLAELRRDFEAGRRPRAGDPVRTSKEPNVQIASVFSERWLILEHVGGDMPDIRAAALVARAIRDTVLSGYRRIGLQDGVPEIVSGHTKDGRPSREPHVAVVPMPFAGFPHADGHVVGFALVPPRPGRILHDADFRRALRAVAPMDEDRGRRIMMVWTRTDDGADDRGVVEFSPAFEPTVSRRSLDSKLYTSAARDFATVTPIALDRHLKAEGEAREQEIRDQIAVACRNIGLPEPEAIMADKHTATEGVPSAYPSGRAPAWTRWRLPGSLATRQLTHAFLRFPDDVQGPVILGAGRFFGLGLCRPVGP